MKTVFRKLISGWISFQKKQRILNIRKKNRTLIPLKVVLGSGQTDYDGWISTDIDILDIVSEQCWNDLFQKNSIDLLLAEHVLEHLTVSQLLTALQLTYCYLKPGGKFRIAVPDGYRRDSKYLAEVSPPKDGHKILFNVTMLSTLLEETGFIAKPLEFFDSKGKFCFSEWSVEEGFVLRSLRYDSQEEFRIGNMFYTSLIIDAIKPRLGELKGG